MSIIVAATSHKNILEMNVMNGIRPSLRPGREKLDFLGDFVPKTGTFCGLVKNYGNSVDVHQ